MAPRDFALAMIVSDEPTYSPFKCFHPSCSCPYFQWRWTRPSPWQLGLASLVHLLRLAWLSRKFLVSRKEAVYSHDWLYKQASSHFFRVSLGDLPSIYDSTHTHTSKASFWVVLFLLMVFVTGKSGLSF
jgi:hypothetical protein